MSLTVASDAQKQQLLFAPSTNVKTGELMPDERVFKTENTQKVVLEGKKKALKHKEFTIKGATPSTPHIHTHTRHTIPRHACTSVSVATNGHGTRNSRKARYVLHTLTSVCAPQAWA